MKDNLVTCKRCGGNACYEQHIDESTNTWMCFGCGFTTTSIMNKEGEAAANARATSPELYKDLEFVDDKNLSWFPATITLPNKGMVFLDGTGKDNWGWTAVKAVPLQEGDTKVDPKQTHKMDMNNKQQFSQKDFMDALEVIGFYEA